jgi:hypothetical protein
LSNAVKRKGSKVTNGQSDLKADHDLYLTTASGGKTTSVHGSGFIQRSGVQLFILGVFNH